MAKSNIQLRGAGNIKRKRRVVPELRRKYGTPENKKELLARLATKRAEENKEKDLLKKIASRKPDEFHFGYYSMNSKMERVVKMTERELKATLRYIEGEMSKCERKRKTGISKENINKHIKYDDSGNEIFDRQDSIGSMLSSEDDNEDRSSEDSLESEEYNDMDDYTDDLSAGDEYSEYINSLLQKKEEVIKKLEILKFKKGKQRH